MKPQTPAPKKAIDRAAERPQQGGLSSGGRGRPFQTIVKAKITMAKKGAISKVEKMLPIHCQ